MPEYQVIARKWRPQKFSDVVGQSHVVQTLTNAIANDRTAHAYLFVGPRGVGKTTLARIFAKAMNCLSPQNGEPCCQCESCRAIFEERSLDVIEVDAASRNSTSDMRELAEDVLTRPSTGRYKIYIIDEVHMLSKQAWNVLLKTVEEPPAHVKFIFATTEVHQVLPTIISRCQRFDLLPIQTKLISGRLRLIADAEQVAVTDGAISAIARAAEGGMRDAQSLLDQMIAFFSRNGEQITEDQVLSLFGLTDLNDLWSLLQAMLANTPQTIVSVIGNLVKRGKNLETLFDNLLSALRTLQLCTIMDDPSELLDETPESLESYRKLAKTVSPDVIQILLENLAPVGRVLHDALNKQVFLETIILKAMRLAHAVKLQDILRRLNQLRTAGELKFLDNLPPAEAVISASAQDIPSPVPAREPAIAISAPKESPVEVPVPEPEPEVIPEPEPNRNAVVENATPQLEMQLENKAAAVQEPVAETLDIQAEKPAEVAGVPLHQTDADKANSGNDACITALQEESVSDPADAEIDAISDDIEESAPELSGETTASTALDRELMDQLGDDSESRLKPESSGNTERRSIVNDDPQSIRRVSNEPLVAEILELFSGQVIDIHQ